MVEVSAPQVWKFMNEDIVICQSGYKWLSILPSNEYYCITAMMNEKQEVILWYIDMIETQGLDKDGIPYFDDLYLDLVVYPDGTVLEDDRDELEAALNHGDINRRMFELANNTCQTLKSRIQVDIDSFRKYTYDCMRLLNESKMAYEG